MSQWGTKKIDFDNFAYVYCFKGVWIRARGGNLARTTLYEKYHGIFNDHRESGPRFKVSSEGRCLLTV